MKVLIIAGPYEADRIRRAAVSVGIEALAIEPGESLSGWITATRPEVIILAPQIVSADVTKALGKIRAVPRGRVPILLVGDSDDREKLAGQADGFFARPVVTDALFARARELAAQVVARSADDGGSGPGSVAGPEVAGQSGGGSGPREDSGRVRVGIAAEGTPVRTPTLRPLVATRESRSSAPRDLDVAASRGERRKPPLSAALAHEIETTFDAELAAVVRAVGALRQASASTFGSEATPKETEAAVDRAGVVALYQRVQDGDYFEILGVPRTADAPEIQRVVEKIQRAFAPEALPAPLVTELATELAEIRLVLAEAARLLSNDKLRAAYARHLPRGLAPRPHDPTATAAPSSAEVAGTERAASALGDQGMVP